MGTCSPLALTPLMAMDMAHVIGTLPPIARGAARGCGVQTWVTSWAWLIGSDPLGCVMTPVNFLHGWLPMVALPGGDGVLPPVW